jgi:exonuclease III
MKLVSWNCRGLGNEPTLLDVRDLIRSEKPQILVIQEAKLCVDEVDKIIKRVWRTIKTTFFYSRGASGGLRTI